jgi:hypothetical protein
VVFTEARGLISGDWGEISDIYILYIRAIILLNIGDNSRIFYITVMSTKNFGPQYLTADGRFTKERPNWLHSKITEPPPQKKMLSEAAAQKVAKILHIMLNDKK